MQCPSALLRAQHLDLGLYFTSVVEVFPDEVNIDEFAGPDGYASDLVLSYCVLDHPTGDVTPRVVLPDQGDCFVDGCNGGHTIVDYCVFLLFILM